ncbi:lipoate--protein ligase family protein [Candidatus Saganbacteria bacterium]|nr:lipoate--protein ligase family protein [Candidatus Saganbacteria bacterium]
MRSANLLTDRRKSGSRHMQQDIDLFNDHEKGQIPAVLRVYSWDPPCISLGYSQILENEIDIEKAKKLGWDVVKRPTGGGIVFHNEAEVTYSLITGIDRLPAGLIPSYKKISEAVVTGLSKIGIRAEIRPQNIEHRALNTGLCFSYPAEYEIVVDGRKIVGSAQKRGRRALLQQGSIFVRPTDHRLFSVLMKPHDPENSVSVEEVLGRKVGFDELSQALSEGFREGLGIEI